MATITVQTADDSAHYANVWILADGCVGIQLCRRARWDKNTKRPLGGLICTTKHDLPLHVVLDRVHLFLERLAKSEGVAS